MNRAAVGEVSGEATERVFDDGLVALGVSLETLDYVRNASGPAPQHVDEVEGVLRLGAVSEGERLEDDESGRAADRHRPLHLLSLQGVTGDLDLLALV